MLMVFQFDWCQRSSLILLMLMMSRSRGVWKLSIFFLEFSEKCLNVSCFWRSYEATSGICCFWGITNSSWSIKQWIQTFILDLHFPLLPSGNNTWGDNGLSDLSLALFLLTSVFFVPEGALFPRLAGSVHLAPLCTQGTDKVWFKSCSVQQRCHEGRSRSLQWKVEAWQKERNYYSLFSIQ